MFIPPIASLLVNPDGHQHALCQNLTLNLPIWKILEQVILYDTYQVKLSPSLKVADTRAYKIITKRAGESLFAGVK